MKWIWGKISPAAVSRASYDLGLAGPKFQMYFLSRGVLVLGVLVRATAFQKCQIPETGCGSELSIKLLLWKQI